MARFSSSRNPSSAGLPRPPWGWALLGLLLGALPALAVFAPARWLAAGVAGASGGQVQLAEPRGTVWDGSAQLLLTGGSGSQDHATLPSRLQWRIRPAWAGVHAELRTDCCTTAGPIALAARAGWNTVRVQIADGRSQWPAAVLAGLGTPWNTVQPQGRLALSTQALALTWANGRMQLAGSAQLDALDMSSRLSTLRPMGSYRLALSGNGPAPTLTLSTLGGALLLQGSGQWVGDRLRFTGEATAAPDREAALANLLNIIGRRTGARSIITVG